jgi:hypothetical protein
MSPAVAAAMHWTPPNAVAIAVSAISPLMMLWFYFLEHSMRAARAEF